MHPKEKILLYSSNIWFMAQGMLGPLLAVFTEQIGGNTLDISWAVATFLTIKGVLELAIGKLSEHHAKEKILVFGFGLNAILTFCYAFVQTPFQLFLLQAGLGAAVAMINPMWNALYAKYEEKGRDGYDWGLAAGEGEILMGIAILIGGLIVSNFSFTVLFVIMGSIHVIATLYLTRIFRHTRRLKAKP